MKSGQFVKGKIGGVQKTFESPGIDKILPYEKLGELSDISDLGEHPQFFKQKVTLINSVVTPAKNSDGRPGGIINFTVFYQFDRTLTHETAPYIIDIDKLISEVLMGKRKWKMPPMPTLPDTDSDFALIDPPPPIEWEV